MQLSPLNMCICFIYVNYKNQHKDFQKVVLSVCSSRYIEVCEGKHIASLYIRLSNLNNSFGYFSSNNYQNESKIEHAIKGIENIVRLYKLSFFIKSTSIAVCLKAKSKLHHRPYQWNLEKLLYFEKKSKTYTHPTHWR